MTLASLEAWLRVTGVDTSRWASNNAKSVNDLHREILARESTLVGKCRQVRVVIVTLCSHGKVLHEVAQELKDGRRRQVERLPAEKLKGFELPISGAARWMTQEIGDFSPTWRATIPGAPLEGRVEVSRSYPGLLTRYDRYGVRIDATGLPPVSFETRERSPERQDPVRVHFWDWR